MEARHAEDFAEWGRVIWAEVIIKVQLRGSKLLAVLLKFNLEDHFKRAEVFDTLYGKAMYVDMLKTVQINSVKPENFLVMVMHWHFRLPIWVVGL